MYFISIKRTQKKKSFIFQMTLGLEKYHGSTWYLGFLHGSRGSTLDLEIFQGSRGVNLEHRKISGVKRGQPGTQKNFKGQEGSTLGRPNQMNIPLIFDYMYNKIVLMRKNPLFCEVLLVIYEKQEMNINHSALQPEKA